MKELNPRHLKNPTGWRTVYDAFRAFRSIAYKVGEPTEGWKLEYPATIGERLKGNWRLTYTLFGTVQTVYIGYDAETATAGIKEMITSYPKHKRDADKQITPPVQKKRALIEIPEVVVKLFGEWNAIITKVGRTVSIEQYERDYAQHIRLLNTRAGILPMNMRQYLTNHPHAQYWPTPPMSQQQMDRRTQELTRILQQRDRRKQEETGY